MGLTSLGTASLATTQASTGLSGAAKATMGLQAVGGVASAVAAYDQAAMLRGNLEFQADIAEINAGIAEDRAENALELGQDQVADLTLQTGQLQGHQRAAMAANGIVLGEGSSGDIMRSTEFMKSRDVLRIQEQAIYNAWGYGTQVGNYRSQAAMQRVSAAGTNPMMAAGSSLLGSAGRVAGTWYNMKYRGA